MTIPLLLDGSMHMRTLGHTGLPVSKLGLGLAALGRPGYINLGHADDLGHDYDEAAMSRHAATVLDAAWAGGVRYFDAARSYGRSEQFLADWLGRRQDSHDSFTVGSKWGYTYTAGWQVAADKHEVKDHSAAALSSQFAESKALLGSFLGLYQVHSVTPESGLLDDPNVLRALADLHHHGLAVGLTVSGPSQAETLRRALDIRVDGKRVFDCVQATWNLLEPSTTSALADAHAQGLGVIVKEALANGRLTARNTAADFAPARARLEATARSLDTTLDAFALAAVLAQPWADVVLSGATTVAQLESNLSATSLAPARVVAVLDSLVDLAEAPAVYWKRRSGLAWN